jgi:hypothetical protein
VEARLVGELDAELGEAGVDPAVAAVEVRVPEHARVERGREAARERPADRDAGAAVRHGEAVQRVLRRGLGARAEVPGLAVVVPAQRVEQVREDEGGVVVGEHEPPHILLLLLIQRGDELPGDARDADGRGEAAPVGVGEARRVGGDAEGEARWEVAGVRRRRVQEEERARGGAQPEPEQRETERQRAPGGGDPEYHVAQGRRLQRLLRLRRRWWYVYVGGEWRRVRAGRLRRRVGAGYSEERRGHGTGSRAVEELEHDGDGEKRQREEEERAEGDAVGRGRHGRRRRRARGGGGGGLRGKWKAGGRRMQRKNEPSVSSGSREERISCGECGVKFKSISLGGTDS